MSDLKPIGTMVGAFIHTLALDAERAMRRKDGTMSVSLAEASLLEAFWELGAKPEQQKEVGPYSADFFFSAGPLAVEVDGKDHQKRLDRDRQRDAYFAERGISTLRIDAGWCFHQPLYCARVTAAVLGLVRAGTLFGPIQWNEVKRRFPGLKERKDEPKDDLGHLIEGPTEPDPNRVWDDAWFEAQRRTAAE